MRCKTARRKIIEKIFLCSVLCKGKGVFLQSRFTHLTNGAGEEGCAPARRGERGDGPSSLNEWKDVANNSSCFLRASSDSYIQDERKRPGKTNKERD